MEIDGHLHGSLQFADNRGCAAGINKAGHILEGDDFRAQTLHLHGEVYEILVGENLLGSCWSLFFLAEE